MPKGLRVTGYVIFGVFSFLLFIYLTFPFDALKDRILADVEKNLKGEYEISVGSVSPRLLIGVTLKSVKIIDRGGGTAAAVFEADRVRLKTSLISMMFGSPTVKYDVKVGKGRIVGKIGSEKNKTHLEMRLVDFDLGKIAFLLSKYGLQLKSEINGDIKLDLDSEQIIRSTGIINMEPNGIKILPSKLKAGALGEVDIPEMLIAGGKSVISADLQRGAIKVNKFVFEQGDFDLDLNGSVYLSSKFENFRLNLKGGFKISDKMNQALPFLFIISNQKKEDGVYPVTISGRLAKPQIKIGDFNVPL